MTSQKDLILPELRANPRASYEEIANNIRRKKQVEVKIKYVGDIARKYGLNVGRGAAAAAMPSPSVTTDLPIEMVADEIPAEQENKNTTEPSVSEHDSLSAIEKTKMMGTASVSSQILRIFDRYSDPHIHRELSNISTTLEEMLKEILEQERARAKDFHDSSWSPWLSIDPNVGMPYELAENPSVLHATIRRLASYLALRARAHVASETNDLVLLETLTQDANAIVRAYAAHNENLSDEMFDRLLSDSNSKVRCCVIYNPNPPERAFVRLATDREKYIRKKVAEHHRTPGYVLKKQASDDDINVLFALAHNRITPADALHQLSCHPSIGLQKVVARHPSTSGKTLYKQVTDNIYDIYYNVAGLIADNEATPEYVLDKLASHPEDFVRNNVAENRFASVATLTRLLDDEDEDVRWNAEINLDSKMGIVSSKARI